MRILILDDDRERHECLAERWAGHDRVHVKTVQEAKDALMSGHFDLALLDHDLGDYGPRDMYGYREEYTGQHVAWFINNMDDPPDAVIVHSHNPEGAMKMIRALRMVCIPCKYELFEFDNGVAKD